jgi:flagellar hook-basal body complex protein FliE
MQISNIKNLSYTIPNLNNNQINNTKNDKSPSFTHFLKDQVQGFVERSQVSEQKALDYIHGKGDIEHLVPLVKNMVLEFEANTKILGAGINSLKEILRTNV